MHPVFESGSSRLPAPVGLPEIVAGLRGLGLGRGDRVMVHASVSSFGHVAGGAGTVVQAILQVLGPSGTLLVPYFLAPSFTEPFNPLAPPPPWTGAISRAAAAWPGAMLSWHPTHPVVAIGPAAEELVCDHHRLSAVGIGSPEDRLAQMGGKVLLLGVRQRTNTTIHVGEAYAGVPYWGRRRPDRAAGRWTILPGEGETWVPVPEWPGDSAGFDNIEPFLAERGLVTAGRIRQATCQLMSGQRIIEAVVAFLAQDPGGLLCDQPDCSYCLWARQFVAGAPSPADGGAGPAGRSL